MKVNNMNTALDHRTEKTMNAANPRDAEVTSHPTKAALSRHENEQKAGEDRAETTSAPQDSAQSVETIAKNEQSLQKPGKRVDVLG